MLRCLNKPALVKKMFRSMRYCYFLTGNYGKVSNVALKKPFNAIGIHSVPRALYSYDLEKTYIFDTLGVDQVSGTNFNFCHSGKYWNDVLTSAEGDIIWDECLARSDVPKEPGINVHALILLTCQRNKLHDCAISFFDYLRKKEEITAGLLYLFCNFMSEYPENFRSCEDMIYEIFLNVMKTDKISAANCSKILLQSAKYSRIVYDCYKNDMVDDDKLSSTIMGLIEGKKMKQAYELYMKQKFQIFWIEKHFLEYFLEETKNGKLPVSDICQFLNDTTKFNSGLTIPEDNIYVLQELFKKLRLIDKNYTWIVQKEGAIGKVCPFCKGKLTHTIITQEEIDSLRKDLEENIIIQDSIFLKSNYEEWDKFRNFLNKIEYNIVMDGLNIKYALRDYVKFEELISKIISHGLVPFVLARSHFCKSPEFKLVRKNFPVFLTENLSDDDVFVLYAALKKGKGCYTLTNDKMSFCNHLLSTPELINIYKRWQATHQCKLGAWRSIMFPPGIAAGVQKCTGGENGEFRYHYVFSHGLSPSTLICISRIKKQRGFKF